MNAILERVPLFALVLLRLGGVTLLAPIFSNSIVSAKIKVYFSLSLAIFLAGVLPIAPPPSSPFGWVGAGVRETIVGLVLGLGFRMAFSVASVAGEFMGLQMGMGAATLLDPNSAQTVSPLEQFYSTAFATLFIACNGHHHMLRALEASYSAIPLGRSNSLPMPAELLVIQAGKMLACGVRLAAPVVLPLFLLAFALALVSRAYPQMNVWSLSYGVSILAGLVLLAATIPGTTVVVEETMREIDRFAASAFRLITG